MPSHAEHCTFCDLIKGSAEVSVCHEDADSIAFMDIQPVNAGHVLVVPRDHYESLLDVPQEIGTHLFRVTMRLAAAIRHVTDCDGLNIVVNSGAAAGQDEPHYHVHIIPRRVNDGFDIELPFGGSSMPDRTMLDATAAQLIAAMRDPMKADDAHGGSASSHEHPAPSANADAPEAWAAKTVEIPVDEIRRLSVMTAKTVEIPAEEIRRMSAPTADLPSRAIRPAPIEREVVVKVAREGVSSGDPARLGVWKVEEGAHGELIYDPQDRI
jgi:histidine triad (HIT) family protein